MKQASTYRFRENFQVISDDLIFDLPFQGSVAPTDGQLITFSHTDESHANHRAILRKTVKCHRAECPKDNFVWERYGDKSPMLKNERLVPDGWWKQGINRAEVRIDTFLDMLGENLSGIDKSAGINNKRVNEQIDAIIDKRFAKNLPVWSRNKLHNVLWHMLKSGEPLRVYHVIISPPSDVEWKLKADQTAMRKAEKKLFIEAGGWGGFIAAHHARIKDKFNDPDDPAFLGYEREDDAEGFHFHIVGFGFFDFKRWEKSGWVLVNKGKVENVSGLISYILNHASVISSREVRSLSCESADRKLSNQQNNNFDVLELINLSNPTNIGHEEFEDDDFLNDFKGSRNTVANSINDFKGFHTTANSFNEIQVLRKVKKKPVRHAFKIYWFSGCLHESKFKVEKPKQKCSLTDHELDWRRVEAVDVYKREYMVPKEDWIEHKREEYFVAKFLGDEREAEKIAKRTQEIIDGKKQVWIEEKVKPHDYERYLKRITSKFDDLGEGEITFGRYSKKDKDVKEWAEIEIARDPMKAWFALDINDLFIFIRPRWKGRFDD